MSFWEDQASITQWRNQMAHSIAEQTGIVPCLFNSYRIRVAEVVQDYSETVHIEAE
ncbi:hypothetical protein MZ018_02535 [Shewanella sp. JNE10-2]|nr:hypothetical protein [Shewanella sp. JNE9-1]MCK7635376.1 hypothetical protein [Shewanella sp. JNE17]MCK7646031.1 hypothetical protein [Shewanella sp. JNE3-1]MCK7650563.1 hypothetical protein [Shewanella sp. JNE8]MCK7654017.1 hypothetical protein [Shewanella sp. JNE4-1]MCK7658800.1 hypothetical protein [Shewanella sp. JNE4-2]UPO27696.1 hypothetical protein MZ018_02535 [Shewanella sp. JNE10-2]UPO30795.1 hypothetical protein MZ182_17725 [Shewanella sp. JNE2]UPO34903.1 hypothetical protein M